MQYLKLSCVILGCLFLLGASCGAPTEYEKYKSSQKHVCVANCEKAHANTDKDGLRRCIQVCKVRREMTELDAEEEAEAEEERSY